MSATLTDVEQASTIDYGDKMEVLVANLVERGEIDFDALIQAGYGTTMKLGELSVWLNEHSAELRRRQNERLTAFRSRVAEAFAPQAR
jgi:hypothetical protein